MKKFVLLTAVVILALPSSAYAQGASNVSPGHQMQDKKQPVPVPGSPGASGYAPGQQMQHNKPLPGTSGASGYAPGHVKDDPKANKK